MEIKVVQNKDYKVYIEESEYETSVVEKLKNRNTEIANIEMIK